jgi:cell division protein FtsW (lipid II flippase)
MAGIDQVALLTQAVQAPHDLTGPFILLSFTGAILALFVMQATWNDALSQTDPPWLQWIRRMTYIALILAMMWVILSMDDHGWVPTPPIFTLMLALNLMFFVRAINLFHHRNDADKHPEAIRRIAGN